MNTKQALLLMAVFFIIIVFRQPTETPQPGPLNIEVLEDDSESEEGAAEDPENVVDDDVMIQSPPEIEIDICESFTNMYGEYKLKARLACLLYGKWICEEDSVGCYNLNLDSLGVDVNSLCESETSTAISEGCESAGATYTCNENQVSCQKVM